MENLNPNSTIVQIVAKPSSDQLLRKFAEVASDPTAKSVAKRIKRASSKRSGSKIPTLSERKSLLPQPICRNPVWLTRRLRLKLSRAKIRGKNKSIIGAIEKTWHATVEGASRVLMEKYCKRHKRLIQDHTN